MLAFPLKRRYNRHRGKSAIVPNREFCSISLLLRSGLQGSNRAESVLLYSPLHIQLLYSQWDTFFHSLPSNSGFVLEHIENSQPGAVEGNVFPPLMNQRSIPSTPRFLIPGSFLSRRRLVTAMGDIPRISAVSLVVSSSFPRFHLLCYYYRMYARNLKESFQNFLQYSTRPICPEAPAGQQAPVVFRRTYHSRKGESCLRCFLEERPVLLWHPGQIRL